MRGFARCCSVAVLLFATSCSSETRTMLVVEVGSNLSVPTELSRIEVVVKKAGAIRQRIPFALSGNNTLPIRAGLIAVENQKGEEIEISAVGYRGDEVAVAEDAVVAFVEGRSMLLKLFLARECQMSACRAEQTCSIGGACRTKVRAPAELQVFEPAGSIQKGDAAVLMVQGEDTGRFRDLGATTQPPTPADADRAAMDRSDSGVPFLPALVDAPLPLVDSVDSSIGPLQADLGGPPTQQPDAPLSMLRDVGIDTNRDVAQDMLGWMVDAPVFPPDLRPVATTCSADGQCGSGVCLANTDGVKRCCDRRCDQKCEVCFSGQCSPRADFTACDTSYCQNPRESQDQPCVAQGRWCKAGACKAYSINCCAILDTTYMCTRAMGQTTHCYHRLDTATCVAGPGGTTNSYCDTSKILAACTPTTACTETTPTPNVRQMVVSSFVLNSAYTDLTITSKDIVKITATGRWCKGALCSGPEGWSAATPTSYLPYLGPGAREGQLLASVGGSGWFIVGPSYLGSPGTGSLVFQINDNNNNNDTGSLDVVIEISR